MKCYVSIPVYEYPTDNTYGSNPKYGLFNTIPFCMDSFMNMI